MVMQFDNLTPDQWHMANSRATAATAVNLYGTPQAWYKRSLYLQDMKGSAVPHLRYITTIRAAAIFDRSVSLAGIASDVPYCMVCDLPHRRFRVVLVSTAEPQAWLAQAWARGAEAIWLSTPGPVFEYQLVQHPSPAEETDTPIRGVNGRLDRAAVIADIQHGGMSLTEIAARYEVTPEMIYKINRKLVREGAGGRPTQRRAKITVEDSVVPQIIRDITSREFTKQQIADRNSVPVQAVSTIIIKHKLQGFLTQGWQARKPHRAYGE